MPAHIENIAQAWEDYRAVVMPKNAGPFQVQECRRAFYAGAQSFFALIAQNLDESKEVTDTDVAQLALLDEELRAFADDVKEGLA